MKKLTLISTLMLAAMLAMPVMAQNYRATGNFLDQLCSQSSTPEGARPDDDICGLRDQGKWQPIRNQLSKMIVANRNAGNPNVYYTDAKHFGAPSVVVNLFRPWMKQDNWKATNTERANCVDVILQSAEEREKDDRPEDFLSFSLCKYTMRSNVGFPKPPALAFGLEKIGGRLFLYDSRKYGGYGVHLIRNPEQAKNFIESYLDCMSVWENRLWMWRYTHGEFNKSEELQRSLQVDLDERHQVVGVDNGRISCPTN